MLNATELYGSLIIGTTICDLNSCREDSIVDCDTVHLILTDTSAYYSDDDLNVTIETLGDNEIDSLIVPSQPINRSIPTYPVGVRRNNI